MYIKKGNILYDHLKRLNLNTKKKPLLVIK